MKKTKSFLAILVAIAMLLTCIPATLMAEPVATMPSWESGINISNVTASVGDTVTYEIAFYGPDAYINTVAMKVFWNPAVLEYTGYTKDGYGISIDSAPVVTETYANLATNPYWQTAIAVDDNQDWSAGSAFVALNFTVKDGATTTSPAIWVDENASSYSNEDFDDIMFPASNGGNFTLAGSGTTTGPVATMPAWQDGINISNVTASVGDSVSYEIAFYGPNAYINTVAMKVFWNPAVLEYTGYTGTGYGISIDSAPVVTETYANLATNPYWQNAIAVDDNQDWSAGVTYVALNFTVKDGATTTSPAIWVDENASSYSNEDFDDIMFPASNGGNFTLATGEVTPPPATEYNVTVTNGTSDVAKAEEGATVTITAAAPATGMVFDKWVVSAGGVTLANANSASTTFTMGTADVAVEATYKAMTVDVYVTNGAYTGTAAYGQTITITADAAPTGKTFDKWVVTSGNVTLANANAATTTFTMGTEAVQVQATYKNVNYTVATGAATDGTISVAPTTAIYGETVTVTVSPAAGKKLATLYYTVDGSATQNPINTALKTFTMPAGNVTVYATFADITGITITGDYRGETGDEIYTGDTNVTVDFTVSDNAESIAALTFTLDIEAGLTTGAVTFTAAEGLEILASNGNTYTVWSPAAAVDMTAETFKLGTVTIAAVTAASSTADTQYKVSMTIDEFMVSDGNADAVDATVVDGTVYVSKTVASIKFYDKSNNYSEFTAIEVDETIADKDGYVANYINTNVAYKITYTDGTTDADYTDATADMFADLTTDVTDTMVGGDQATITGSYTQTATEETVTADVAVSIALNETIVAIEVTPDTLYFKLGDTFAWGDTQYTLTQANQGTVGPNAVNAGVLAGTLTANTAALDNTSTAKQTITVAYADDPTITDTVDVYFVAATIVDADFTQVYYEEGAIFAAANNNISIEVSYDEARTGIANDTITTGIDVTAPALTLTTDAIATAKDVVISYNGSADYTLEDAVVVVDFAEFGKVLVKALTADATVTDLLKLSNYGTALVTTDLIAVRNVAIRK